MKKIVFGLILMLVTSFAFSAPKPTRIKSEFGFAVPVTNVAIEVSSLKEVMLLPPAPKCDDGSASTVVPWTNMNGVVLGSLAYCNIPTFGGAYIVGTIGTGQTAWSVY